MGNLKTPDEFLARACAERVNSAMVNFPDYVIFANSPDRGGFAYINCTESNQQLLCQSIYDNLKSNPKLLATFKSIIDKL